MGKKFSLEERFEQFMYSLGKKAGDKFCEKEEKRARELGVPAAPVKTAPVRTKKDYVYFGSYPQTIKPQNVTICSREGDGVFKGSDGNLYYQKNSNGKFNLYNRYMKGNYIEAINSESLMRFTNGEKRTGGEYYKIEPIKWRIVHREYGILTLLCENMLFFTDYLDDRINTLSDYRKCKKWENSHLREILNDDFYYAAFTQNERDKILTSYVKIIGKSSLFSDGISSTNDKVYVLSREECSEYGLNWVDLSKHQTDFCGPYIDYIEPDSPKTVYGAWITRSPIGNVENTVFLINGNGGVMQPGPLSNPGVAPVIRVRESDVYVNSPKSKANTNANASAQPNGANAYQSDGGNVYQSVPDTTAKAPDLIGKPKRILFSVLCILLTFAGELPAVLFFKIGAVGLVGGLIMLGYLILSEVIVWKSNNKILIYVFTFANFLVTALDWILLGGKF